MSGMARRQMAVWGALVVALAAVNAAWAVNYTNTAAGNWNAAIWSAAGYPGQNAGDTANFVGAVNRTVTFNVSPANVLNAFNVSGSAAWQWPGYTYTLLLGAGNLNYSSSNTLAGISGFEAILNGSGGVRMNSGVLRLGSRNVPNGTTTHANLYTGGTEVNGGVLLSGHASWEVASGKELGTGTIIIGSASPGSNDATLLLHYGGTYTNSLTVRAGNSGVARLGRCGLGQQSVPGAYLTGPVALQKDLTIVNDESSVSGIYGAREYFYPLYLTGPMTGSGNVTKEGTGNVYLEGANSYAGTTTIRGGTVLVRSTANSNTGNFTVEYGSLIAQTNNSLGNLANTVTLGGNGTFGEFGSYRADGLNRVVPFSRSITLAGNGGVLSKRGFARWQMDGVISGSGRLILSAGHDMNNRSYLNGNNLHTGGVIANNGYVDINNISAHNDTVYGSGDIWVLRSASLFVRGVSNIGPLAKVRLDYPASLSIMVDYVPDITTNSDGIIGFGLTTGSTINDRFASSTPLGNGSMWLGTTPDADCNFTGSSLAALVANGTLRTYRLGRNGYSTRKLVMNASGTAGALKDLGGNPHHVLIGAIRVDLADDNPFTGTLTVQSGASCYGYLPDATGNPFGTNTGAVVLQGAKTANHNEKFQVVNSYNATRTLSKGAISFDGNVGPFSIDGRSTAGVPTWPTTVAVNSLVRVGRSTLSIDAVDTTLGDLERLTVSGGVPSNNGMVAPYLWNGVDETFLDYGANGFTNAGWNETLLSGATANEKVNITVAAQVPASGVSLYALKSSVAINANGAAVLTNHSGGMILTGNNITHTAPMDFGANEAVLQIRQANILSGRLTGSGGLTKSGPGTLSLRADNTGSLTGGITVNEGTLDFDAWNRLGGTANTITLNGGTLNANAQTTAITNNIVLGTLGGSLLIGTYAGNISGPGTLYLGGYNEYRTVLKGTHTYGGGTVVQGTPVALAAGTSLSTGGVVTVWSTGHQLGNDRAILTLNDAGNLTTAHSLVVNSYNGTVFFNSSAPVVGSIEGNGTIGFGAGNVNSTLRVGGNNRSTDYFGTLVDNWNFSATPRANIYAGKLVKEGSGTLTLWGESWYRGGTIVSNGTLCVNNWMNPVGTVVVKPGATLDGIGRVGVVDNQGGTVKGKLVTAGLTWGAGAVLQVALNGAGDYDVVTVNGPVTLNGTLSIDLNYVPAMGQEFTIIANDGTDPVSGAFDADTINVTYNGAVVRFQVVINGGDGNDVVLVRIPTGTMIVVK